LKEKARKSVEDWITKEFGRRCKVYSAYCPTCEMWELYDKMFIDIEAEYTWHKKIEE